MGLATLPSPSEGMLILLLVNTATSFALLKDLIRVLLHAIGFHLPSDECSDLYTSPDNCQNRKSYTQQLIEDFRSWSPIINFKTVCFDDCSEVQQECSVCLNHFESESRINKLECGHLFHNVCLEKWLKYSNTTCPLCRTPMMPQEEEEVDCFFI